MREHVCSFSHDFDMIIQSSVHSFISCSVHTVCLLSVKYCEYTMKKMHLRKGSKVMESSGNYGHFLDSEQNKKGCNRNVLQFKLTFKNFKKSFVLCDFKSK